jgi:hypothetical protein
MNGREYAQLTRMLRCSKDQEISLGACHHKFISPLKE